MVYENLNLPSSVYPVPVLPIQGYPKVHHLVKNLFLAKISQWLLLARRGKHFAKKLVKFNKRSSCVEHSSWISNSFHTKPLTNFFTRWKKLTPQEKELVEEEINEVLKKGAIMKVHLSPDQF